MPDEYYRGVAVLLLAGCDIALRWNFDRHAELLLGVRRAPGRRMLPRSREEWMLIVTLGTRYLTMVAAAFEVVRFQYSLPVFLATFLIEFILVKNPPRPPMTRRRRHRRKRTPLYWEKARRRHSHPQPSWWNWVS